MVMTGSVIVDAPSPLWMKVGVTDAYQAFERWLMAQGEDLAKFKVSAKRFKMELGTAANSRVGDADAWRRCGDGPIGRSNEKVFDRLTWKDWMSQYPSYLIGNTDA
jgi:hypothetical protein